MRENVSTASVAEATPEVNPLDRVVSGWPAVRRVLSEAHRDLVWRGKHTLDADRTCLTCRLALAHIDEGRTP